MPPTPHPVWCSHFPCASFLPGFWHLCSVSNPSVQRAVPELGPDPPPPTAWSWGLHLHAAVALGGALREAFTEKNLWRAQTLPFWRFENLPSRQYSSCFTFRALCRDLGAQEGRGMAAAAAVSALIWRSRGCGAAALLNCMSGWAPRAGLSPLPAGRLVRSQPLTLVE